MEPYNASEPKKEQVRTMFDRIAPRYDRLNHLLSLGIDRSWRRKTVAMVLRQAPERILDLATGTGDLAIMMARKIPAAHITGADLSENMLGIAKQKTDGRGLSQRITLKVAEAEHLPFGDGQFDAATVAFGIRNFHDIAAGLQEMARVLRPGGRVYILEFSTPRNKIFGALYRFYFHRVLPIVGGWISGDRKAYTYLPGSVDELPAPERFVELMQQCGFTNPRLRRLMTGVAVIYSGEKV